MQALEASLEATAAVACNRFHGNFFSVGIAASRMQRSLVTRLGVLLGNPGHPLAAMAVVW